MGSLDTGFIKQNTIELWDHSSWLHTGRGFWNVEYAIYSDNITARELGRHTVYVFMGDIQCVCVFMGDVKYVCVYGRHSVWYVFMGDIQWMCLWETYSVCVCLWET